jgi:hypothetical protein
MDARTLRCLTVAISFVTLFSTTDAATHQTVNFAVTARNPEVAEQVGKSAEVYRQQLAIFWLGKPLPNWSRPCKITVNEGALGAGGQTTFQFVRGEVLNWRMEVQGSLERILDSVLPHEINHTIFACHFRRPLPRWADEGAATLFEHRSEQLKQLALLNEVIRNKHEVISLRDLLAMKEYPRGQRPMLTLYAQGYALADFLVQQKGRHAYLKFIADGERGNWEDAIRENFDHAGIDSLERNWQGWVLAGMPKLTLSRDQMLAANDASPEAVSQETARPEIVADQTMRSPLSTPKRLPENATVRLQSPDPQRENNDRVEATNQQSELKTTRVEPRTGKSNVGTLPSTNARQSSFNAPIPSTPDGHGGRSTVRKFADNEVDYQPQYPDYESRYYLEQTASASTSDIILPAAESVGRPVELNGILLPRERSGNSGSTPQWAGFPGQKKLF